MGDRFDELVHMAHVFFASLLLQHKGDMASSMITEANGVKVVTHVIPLEEKTESLDLKSSSVELEKSNLSPKTTMFLKGKPLSLGVRTGHSFTAILNLS